MADETVGTEGEMTARGGASSAPGHNPLGTAPAPIPSEASVTKEQVPPAPSNSPAAGAAPAPTQTPNTGATESPAAPSALPRSAPKNDIAKILSEVKLPERRDFKATADPKQQQKRTYAISSALTNFDASPSVESDVQSAPQAAPPAPVPPPTPPRPAAPAATAPTPPVAPVAPAPSASAPAPAASAPANAPQAPAAAPSSVAPLHTLKQDLQHIVHDQKMSYVRMAALESDRPRTEEQAAPAAPAPRRSKTTAVLVIVGILLFIGAAALAGVFIADTMNRAPLPTEQSDSLVFAEQSATFPISGRSAQDLKAQLAQARTASRASLGSITRVIPANTPADPTQTPEPATLSEFLSAIGAHPPADLMRALSDRFFLGLHTVDVTAPFFVIPVTDYDRAFAGMLSWEKTLNTDLSPFFTPVPQFTTGADGIPTQRLFSDVVMRNYDVRALKDDAGQILLYYSFPTRGILIIAESPYTFPELLTRLSAQRQL